MLEYEGIYILLNKYDLMLHCWDVEEFDIVIVIVNLH